VRRFFAACLLAVAWLVPTPSGADVSERSLVPLADFPREPIAVETRSARRHEFDAWRADTARTREQGLMFVREIAAEQAMIFIYDPPADVSMWMKNTLLPLDMLFVDSHGCVTKVEHDAQPGSLAIIAARGLVALVVELKSGIAATLGIGVGDRVLRPTVNWPVDPGPCASGR
jgi:uncharacterized membrane protein (UPF0127 family)